MSKARRFALQQEMTEWTYGLNEMQKAEILAYLRMTSPRAVATAKYIYERMWANTPTRDDGREDD